MTVEARAEQVERQSYAAPGQLVDIGGGQLIHIRSWGQAVPGRPTIVLDVSAAMPSSEWAWIGPRLAERGLVVAYDRPGMGWSTGPDQPRDAAHAADALERALNIAGIPPPYVVVGHSFGGFSARVFAATHRDQLAGLVLLDTTHPDGGGGPGFALRYRLMAWGAHLGLYQLFPPPDDFWELPADERPAAGAVSKWASFLDTAAEELEAWDTSAAELRAIGTLGDMPLLVVCSPSSPEQIRQQRDLATLSTNARYVELNVDHMGMLVNHDQAMLTADEIERFVDELQPADGHL
jgi:pimeloyl-ACP methyl ester carboxylesterase